jgi:hypothetical protein
MEAIKDAFHWILTIIFAPFFWFMNFIANLEYWSRPG